MEYKELAAKHAPLLSEQEFRELEDQPCICPRDPITDNERKIFNLIKSDIVSVSITTVMDILVDNSSCETKGAIAEHGYTSREVLKKLSTDKCHMVRRSLIFNKKLPGDILEELMDDENEVIKLYASEECERRSVKNSKKHES